MANKTVEKISPDAFLNEMNAINDKAKDAVIDLLNKQGDKRYIAVSDWEDECEGDDGDGSELSIFGIGLDDDDEICIAAVVDNIGYGHGPDDFPQEWTKATELYEPNYCAFYRFVAGNIEKAMTKEEADEVTKEYWNGDGDDDGDDYGKYDWQDDFIHNGFVKVKLDGKYGFINEDGEEIVPCKYDDASNFWGGFASVKTKGLWGFVNENGEESIPCKYKVVYDFSGGLARVKTKEGWGFVNKNGKEIIPCKYKEAYGFSEGLAGVKTKKGWGFINKDGEEIIPCKYKEVSLFTMPDGLALVRSKEGYGFINKDGEEIIPCKYKDYNILWSGPNLAEVKLNGEWITIDKTGKQVTK